MLGLYKFYWDCGRMGNLESIFTAEMKEVEEAIGRKVYFGEALGKYSEIYGTLEKQDVELITTNHEFIAIFQENIGNIGRNPLNYIRDDKDN